MRRIAARAGVSVMTVSLALRGSPRVGKSTAQRIKDLAQSMGYQQDPALRALIAYRRTQQSPGYSGTIAYVNNTQSAKVIVNRDVFRDTFNGATERAQSLGYKIEHFWTGEPNMTAERCSSVLKARGIQGLILAPQDKPRVQMSLDWEDFSVVSIGYSTASPHFHIVSPDPFKSVLLCMENLARLGYRRVGLSLLENQDARTQHRYLGGYHAGWDCFPKKGRRIPVHRVPTLEASPLIHWIKKYKLDAVIGSSHLIVGYMKDSGLRIPQDIGFVAPHYVNAVKDYAHVNGGLFEVGSAAVELVSSMIERNEKGIPASPRTHIIEPEWIENGSVRPINPSNEAHSGKHAV